jgi:hypothetical protein
MIDDPVTVTALLRQMVEQLPIPALATTALVHTLRKGGVKIASTRRVQIQVAQQELDASGARSFDQWRLLVHMKIVIAYRSQNKYMK